MNHEQCIDACLHCAAACNHCAASCTKEPHVDKMAVCIRLDMQCAAICSAVADLLSLGSPYAKELSRICAEVCKDCAEECARHDMEHCRICAEACRRCETACLAL